MTSSLESTPSAHNSDGDVNANAAAQARAHGLDQIAAAFDALGGTESTAPETESGAHTKK